MGIFDKLQAALQGSGASRRKNKPVAIESRFDLVREDRSGTMSTFFMARDREHDNRIVGLKLADMEKVEHFESRFKGIKKPSEGEIGMQMNHPLIVKTYEYGISTKKQQFIVMEYVKGPGLHMLLNNRDALLEGNRLRLIREMAEAVEYVHRSRFIHRDVCPRNFIYDEEAQCVKLIDFGLTLPAREEFMQPGNRTGNPLYMAPEVIRRRKTDQRLDIFALGVSAYQLCTHELPWPVLETSGQAAMVHDTQEPKDPLVYRPTLNRSLAKAIMKCIEPDPKDRPQDVAQFLSMISRVEHEDQAA